MDNPYKAGLPPPIIKNMSENEYIHYVADEKAQEVLEVMTDNIISDWQDTESDLDEIISELEEGLGTLKAAISDIRTLSGYGDTGELKELDSTLVEIQLDITGALIGARKIKDSINTKKG